MIEYIKYFLNAQINRLKNIMFYLKVRKLSTTRRSIVRCLSSFTDKRVLSYSEYRERQTWKTAAITAKKEWMNADNKKRREIINRATKVVFKSQFPTEEAEFSYLKKHT